MVRFKRDPGQPFCDSEVSGNAHMQGSGERGKVSYIVSTQELTLEGADLGRCHWARRAALALT